MAEVRTALGLDERDSWAHMAHGMVLWRMRRHGEAERAFRRALEFNPNFALADALLGLPLAVQGEHEEAIRSAERALRLSPNDRLISGYALHATMGAHFAAGRYADCVAWAYRTIERSPENQAAHYFLVAANGMRGDRVATKAALAALMRLRSDFSVTWLSENMAWAGEVGERLIEGLRKAGVPEG
jgi:adenylate cyclase